MTKEETKTTTYRCDNCDEEMGFVSSWTHGHVRVDVVHTVWGSQGTLNIHFCEDCKPDPGGLATNDSHPDHWDTVTNAVFNSHPASNPRITVAKAMWSIPHAGGGESIEQKTERFDEGVQDYIQMIEQACIARYDFSESGPTESSW